MFIRFKTGATWHGAHLETAAKSPIRTPNQRVKGSSPCAPTIDIQRTELPGQRLGCEAGPEAADPRGAKSVFDVITGRPRQPRSIRAKIAVRSSVNRHFDEKHGLASLPASRIG